MALFKISRGLKSNLPETITDGWCYFTTDDKKFWIDYGNERVPINAKNADTLAGAELATVISNDDTKIPTCGAVYANTQELTEAIIELESKTGFQADWNQNDETAIDYIKNRTHYTKPESTELVLVPETIITTTSKGSAGNYNQVPYIDLKVNEKYLVTFDNVEYECVCYTDDPSSSSGAVSIGETDGYKRVYGYGEIPFWYVTFIDEYDGSKRAHLHARPGEHTLKIKQLIDEVHPLDEKYIPDTIARVLTADEAMELLMEMGVITPTATYDGYVLTDENGNILNI